MLKLADTVLILINPSPSNVNFERTFWFFQFFQKKERKISVPRAKIKSFKFVFWKNLRHQKDLSILTDLYIQTTVRVEPKILTDFFLNSKPVHFIMKIYFYKSLMKCIPSSHESEPSWLEP